MIRQIKRTTYITLGSLFLVLGGIGLFMPILPTTPFWLLTCWFYLRSSEKLYRKVMQNKYFGGYMKGFMEEKALTLQAKVVSLVVMWTSAILTSIYLIKNYWIVAGLLVITVCVTFYILSYRTKKT
ncbi:YbaN family protein [Parabacteroides sp. Marseille-P3160]|uniref:YbaN family protein n=1 Tax=Parabacteroides sp. Marseille-P3160 TaxID=1917887 RepID=UPI0009B9F706|nr:YbaN family protein [Parabacteroides sp. Marseille-P3160]